MDNLDETALNVFTDGSSFSNPRKGGIGVRFITIDDDGNEKFYDYTPPGFKGATNNQMELKAAIDALTLLMSRNPPVNTNGFPKIVIHTDSMYISDNVSNAIYSWSKNGWTNKDGGPILNAELWKELLRLMVKIKVRVEFKWVKAHKISIHNKAVDKLAKSSAKMDSRRHISVVDVRRKKSAKSSVVGSVVAKGQILTIRIIQDELMKLHKLYRYRYEVMSKRSPYYQNVDFATSNISMAAGHVYVVRLNNEPKNPKIIKVFREIPKG